MDQILPEIQTSVSETPTVRPGESCTTHGTLKIHFDLVVLDSF